METTARGTETETAAVETTQGDMAQDKTRIISDDRQLILTVFWGQSFGQLRVGRRTIHGTITFDWILWVKKVKGRTIMDR